jgi:hypothetical protein
MTEKPEQTSGLGRKRKDCWHRIALSRHEYESGELAILLGAFREVLVGKNGPQGMAMFGTWDEKGETYWVYITPASARYVRPLLEAYSAAEHDPKYPRALEFLSGDESGRSLLIC